MIFKFLLLLIQWCKLIEVLVLHLLHSNLMKKLSTIDLLDTVCRTVLGLAKNATSSN